MITRVMTNRWDLVSQRPKHRSIPPKKATFWSMITHFSWCVHFTILSGCLITCGGGGDCMLQIILLHTIFYRYDVHDTIILNHIHFGSLLVMRWRFLKKKLLKKKISKFLYKQMSLRTLIWILYILFVFYCNGYIYIMSNFLKYYILLIDNINIW